MTSQRSDSNFGSPKSCLSGTELSGTEVSGTEAIATLQDGLKEWAIAVSALLQGETILLLRKGGIREPNGQFNLPQRRVLLYPTYEHQKPELLKPQFQAQLQYPVEPVPSGWHPATVPIAAWANITQVAEVSEPAQVEALLPWHIWTADFATTRLRWKPRSPLSLLFLRVYRLPEVISLPYHESYGGCRSWLTLQRAIAIAPAQPVLTDALYQQRVEQIWQCINLNAPGG
ncbi:MAG: DUF1802 family protein [Synechococcales bacterium]|nr:DUF1802 family protein [Synechococcales bacterium]